MPTSSAKEDRWAPIWMEQFPEAAILTIWTEQYLETKSLHSQPDRRKTVEHQPSFSVGLLELVIVL